MSGKKTKNVMDEEPVEDLIWGFVNGLYKLHGVDLDPTKEAIRIEDCQIRKGVLNDQG